MKFLGFWTSPNCPRQIQNQLPPNSLWLRNRCVLLAGLPELSAQLFSCIKAHVCSPAQTRLNAWLWAQHCPPFCSPRRAFAIRPKNWLWPKNYPLLILIFLKVSLCTYKYKNHRGSGLLNEFLKEQNTLEQSSLIFATWFSAIIWT